MTECLSSPAGAAFLVSIFVLSTIRRSVLDVAGGTLGYLVVTLGFQIGAAVIISLIAGRGTRSGVGAPNFTVQPSSRLVRRWRDAKVTYFEELRRPVLSAMAAFSLATTVGIMTFERYGSHQLGYRMELSELTCGMVSVVASIPLVRRPKLWLGWSLGATVASVLVQFVLRPNEFDEVGTLLGWTMFLLANAVIGASLLIRARSV